MSQIPLIFCTDGIFPYAVGGMQRHSRLLLEALAATGKVKLTVIHPHQNEKVFDPSYNIEEIVIATGKSSGVYLYDCYAYSERVADVIRSRPEAIVYAQGLSVWSGISEFGKRVIVNPHGLEPYQGLTGKDHLRGLPFRIIFNYIFKRAAYTVALGGHLTRILQGIAGNECVAVLPNAVNLPAAFSKKYDNSPVKLLFVGRFAFNKGIDILMDAVAELNNIGLQKQFELYLVGKGPLYEKYAGSPYLDNVKILGFADDNELNRLYQDCDLFVLPTLFEGMPTVVLEAMAHAMPVVVTDVGATLDMVDSSNGYIIEKKNVASLVKAVQQFLALPATSKEAMGNTAYQKVSNSFTWTRVAEKHVQLFEKLYQQISH